MKTLSILLGMRNFRLLLSVSAGSPVSLLVAALLTFLSASTVQNNFLLLLRRMVHLNVHPLAIVLR
jgi:hypothetical protein